jgi:methyl-accepting chemotaxis protein
MSTPSEELMRATTQRLRARLSEAVSEARTARARLNDAVGALDQPGGQMAALDRFATVTESILTEFVDNILETSKTNMQLVLLVEDLSARMRRVRASADQSQTIATQTNLLAVNAAIEATRSNASRQGFSVVASEIRTLSREAHRFNTEIQEVVEEVSGGLERMRAEVGAVASRDQHLALESKAIVSEMLADLRHVAHTHRNLMVETEGRVVRIEDGLQRTLGELEPSSSSPHPPDDGLGVRS